MLRDAYNLRNVYAKVAHFFTYCDHIFISFHLVKFLNNHTYMPPSMPITYPLMYAAPGSKAKNLTKQATSSTAAIRPKIRQYIEVNILFYLRHHIICCCDKYKIIKLNKNVILEVHNI